MTAKPFFQRPYFPRRPFPGRGFHSPAEKHRINDRIRLPQVRLIDADGRQVGVIDTSQALSMARTQGLDLVEVAPGVQPPVCRIMDYAKFKYDQEKKEKEARRKQHVVHIKEIKLHPHISSHDYQTKLRHMQEFLKRGDKVKITLIYRGREMAHIDHGVQLMERCQKDVSDIGQVEKPARREGRFATMVIAPK